MCTNIHQWIFICLERERERERGEVLISSWEDYWKVMVAGLSPKSVQNPVSHQTGWITEIPSHKLEKDLLPLASEKRIWFSLLALSKTLSVCCGTLSWFWSLGFTQLSGFLAGEENSWQAHAQGIIVFLSINLIRFIKSRREIHTIITQLFASFVKSAALTRCTYTPAAGTDLLWLNNKK